MSNKNSEQSWLSSTPERDMEVDRMRQVARSIIPPPEALRVLEEALGSESPVCADLRRIHRSLELRPDTAMLMFEEWIWLHRPTIVAAVT
ncbi:hypothetical protein [Microbacterium sp. Leaf179]|uniref:hypothetical protein n=1 Tax=Microbacterium sp. Leaf179 TaxID=1736288 RepID=UPI00138EE977|nr:hypothetical protein [Microbacterium sp. Leaf179]